MNLVTLRSWFYLLALVGLALIVVRALAPVAESVFLEGWLDCFWDGLKMGCWPLRGMGVELESPEVARLPFGKIAWHGAGWAIGVTGSSLLMLLAGVRLCELLYGEYHKTRYRRR